MYYLCSENKGADQLRGYREADLRLCFRICKKPVFSRRGSYDITTTGTLSYVVAHPGNDPNEGDLVTVMKGATTAVILDRQDRLTNTPVQLHTHTVTEHICLRNLLHKQKVPCNSVKEHLQENCGGPICFISTQNKPKELLID